MKINIYDFGAMIDGVLKENEVKLLVTFPKGTLDPEVIDNISLGPVIQFYMLLHTMEKVMKEMFIAADTDPDKREELICSVVDLIKEDLIEEISKGDRKQENSNEETE